MINKHDYKGDGLAVFIQEILNFFVQILVHEKSHLRLNFCKWLIIMWAHQDLNLGPPDYESGALTN